jgi:CDP-glucose 4,6-dehydratase
MHILVTGHTGFKGAWLSIYLNSLGHKVSGLSLDPEPESLFALSEIEEFLERDIRQDIRDKSAINKAFIEINPDFVIHLAAQPIVKEGYRNPEYTYEVNVNGTLNVLHSAQESSNTKGVLVITTDKVYANSEENNKPFSEVDALGSGDPYSTSKAMADLLTQSWLENSKGPLVGIARAGNVIGGGDFGVDRLIPDLVRNVKRKEVTSIRYPKAVRPWQHVFDCLNGYVKQMDFILEGNKAIFNFGPDFGQYFEVEEVANKFLELLGTGSWELDNEPHPHEATFLTLDSRKAAKELNWSNKYSFQKSLEVTASWYRDYLDGKNLAHSSKKQVQDYLKQ